MDRVGFEELLTEADHVSPLGTSLFDSSVGLAVRRWCPPVLDLEPHASAEEYLARRRSLGAGEVNRAFLMAADVDTYLVDGGLSPELLLDHRELAAVTGAASFEVVRLERLAEEVVASGCTASGFA